MSELLKLYGKEEYILSVNPRHEDVEIFIAFKVWLSDLSDGARYEGTSCVVSFFL